MTYNSLSSGRACGCRGNGLGLRRLSSGLGRGSGSSRLGSFRSRSLVLDLGLGGFGGLGLLLRRRSVSLGLLDSTSVAASHNAGEVLANDNGVTLGDEVFGNDGRLRGVDSDVDLVRLDAGDLLVGLDLLADLLGQRGQGSLANGLGHLGHLDDDVCIAGSRAAEEAALGVNCAALAQEGAVGEGGHTLRRQHLGGGARQAQQAGRGLHSHSGRHLGYWQRWEEGRER